ncbi:hypothetical protein LBMAG52_35580 [Planctomycetia bacterium]|nr:hypothetical protein LBMAG52_35580 [Planctomycetia bacterium]
MLLLAACLLSALAETGQADDISAVEYQRQTIYHSPQKPGFTSWVGAWTMPDGSLMISFTQATGPVDGRPQAPKEVQHKLTWPPPGHPGYDMTGLDLRNVHLASTDAGKTWQQVSADGFKSCMNGVTNEAQTALADGTILRGVFGFYLPYDSDLPQTGFLQRSSDGSKTWGKPEVPIDAAKYSTWPRRIRVLRDGRIVLLAGVASAPAGSQTRAEFSAVVEPALLISSDQGRTWKGPVPATLAEQRGGWTEEFDIAELPNGDLLTIYRRANDTKRWQSTLKKSDETWIAQRAGPSVLPHSGQPELLATREGPILHVATNGIHSTSDAGQTWNKLNVPGTAYYPRSVQTKDGRIFVFGHVGGDDAYGKADQSIVMDSFRLVAADITVTDRKSLPTDKLIAERIPLGEADDYKPCIAKLPSGELLLTAFHQHKRDGNKVMEQTLLFRSPDGGRTWTGPQPLGLLGREPYLTVLKNGTVFITGHLLAQDVRNEWGYTTGFLHRSTDGGRTWQSTRVESEHVKPNASNHTTRNVLEMSDGSLLLGVDYDGGGGPYFVWRSTDGGQTWDKSQRCEPRDFKSQYGFFGGETWLWQARSGKVWALVRVDSNELPIKDRPIKAGNDQADHFILFSSADAGKTFDRIRDFGDYGEMYMSLLRLHDKRLLLTFTVRDLKPPLGVRALIGTETDDGFEFDFAHDRIQLDTKTPVGKPQGGGFGPSVQLDDGTLVTSYSYRGEDGKSHLEIARWKPPSNEREGTVGGARTTHDPNLYLFVDNHWIAQQEGLTRIHNQARPLEKPIIWPEDPQTEADCAWGNVLREPDGRFRLWYVTMTMGHNGRGPHEIAAAGVWGRGDDFTFRPRSDADRPAVESMLGKYAESDDGIHWQKPKLGLIEYRGRKDNNIVLTGQRAAEQTKGALTNFDGYTILRDDREPNPDRRYKMIAHWESVHYWDNHAVSGSLGRPQQFIDRCGAARGEYITYSPDGLHWEQPLERLESLPSGGGDRLLVVPDHRHQRWMAYTRSGGWAYPSFSYSRDLKSWSPAEPAKQITPGDVQAPAVECMIPFNYGNQDLGFPCGMDKPKGAFTVMLAARHDGGEWSWINHRENFIPHGPPGSYYATGAVPLHNEPFLVGDEMLIYFNAFSRQQTQPSPFGNRTIGLAKLRRDGFAGLKAKDEQTEGRLTTKSITLTGGPMFLNVELRGDERRGREGSVTVALLDERGRELPGFGFTDSIPITTDAIRSAVTWKSNPELKSLAGRSVQVALRVRGAAIVYALANNADPAP